MRVLLPLPITVMASPLPGAGTSSRFRPSASEMRSPEPYSSASTAASRARTHGSRSSPARRSVSARRFAAETGSGLGSVFGKLRGAHRGERRDLAFAVAFEEAGERARAGERAHQRAAADPVGAPRRHEGAHVGRRERASCSQRRLAAQMPGQEGEELRDVALIGLDGLGRHAPLAGEMREPAHHLGRDLAAREGAGRLATVGAVTAGLATRLDIVGYCTPFVPLPLISDLGLNGPTHRRRARAGRARPRLFLQRAARARAEARRSRAPCRSGRASRLRRGVGGERPLQAPPHNRLKDIEEKLDLPPLKEELRKFVDWVSDYTLSSRGMVLRMCLRMGEHSAPSGCAWRCGSPVRRRSA